MTREPAVSHSQKSLREACHAKAMKAAYPHGPDNAITDVCRCFDLWQSISSGCTPVLRVGGRLSK
jgi:hypothetical protein